MECLKILESLAIIAASVAAVYAISSWRREMKGRKEYELAEKVLALFYEAKDKISAIRNPFGFLEEGKSRPQLPNETEEQKRARDQAYIVWERYLKYEDTFNRLHSLRYRFMAIFGKDKVKPFDDLNEVLQDLRAAVVMLGHFWYRRTQTHLPMTEAELTSLNNSIRKYEPVFWEGAESPDSINEKVSAMILEMEKVCGKILKRTKQVSQDSSKIN
jgi:hypothetical protein